MSTATKTYVTSSADAPATLRWQSWPLREKLPRSLLLPAGLLAIEWWLARMTGSHVIGVVAMLLLTASLWRFWVPVGFELSQRGVVQRCLGRTKFTAWSMIGEFQIRHQGVLLIRSHAPATAVMLSSMYLPWGSHRDEVLKTLESLHGSTRKAEH